MKSLEVFSIHYMRCFKVVVVLSSEPWEVLLIKKVLNIIFCQKIEQLQIKKHDFYPILFGGDGILLQIHYIMEQKINLNRYFQSNFVPLCTVYVLLAGNEVAIRLMRINFFKTSLSTK